MSRLKNRLALRMGEHAEAARLLATQAAESLEFDGDSELAQTLEGCFESLTPQGMGVLLEAAQMEAELLDQGDEVAREMLGTAVAVSEEIDDENADHHCVLFGVPLLVTATTPLEAAALPEDTWDTLVQLLKDHQLVDGDCDVDMLPMFLTAAEADAMRLGDTFKLTRALYDGDVDRALEVLRQFQLDMAETLGRAGTPDAAAGEHGVVLLGLATAERDKPMFVLERATAAEMRAVLKHREGDAELAGQEQSHILGELTEVLDALGDALAPVLGARQVRVLTPAQDWCRVRSLAAAQARHSAAMQQLRRMLGVAPDKKPSPEQLRGLVVTSPEILEGAMRYPVARSSDGKPLGVLEWRQLRTERWHGALREFLQFMSEHGLEPGFQEESVLGNDSPSALH